MRKITINQKNHAAVKLGRRGGAKGGPARARKLSKERRSEIARTAAAARWKTANSEEETMSPVTWAKQRLTKSEALLPTQGSLMPFLRFTKERYKIDHKTWFRNTMFAGAPWQPDSLGGTKERATIAVSVTIMMRQSKTHFAQRT